MWLPDGVEKRPWAGVCQRGVAARATDRGPRNFLIESGKPCQNGTNESFNGKFRDECLDMNWFYSQAHAKVIIETWRSTTMSFDPTPAWEHQTPLEFVSQRKSESTTGARVYR